MVYYLLFRGDSHSASGGMADLDGVYATIEEARAARFENVSAHGGDWTHIARVDGDGIEVVDVWGEHGPGGPPHQHDQFDRHVWKVGDHRPYTL